MCKKFILLAVVIVLSFSALNIGFILFDRYDTTDINSQAYNTPEEAVELGLGTTAYKMAEYNDTYLVLCETNVNNYACQYLYKGTEGWYNITDYIHANPYFAKNGKDSEYTVIIREFDGKYMIYVSQPFYSFEENGLLTVSDSLNTSYVELEHTQPFEIHYWYWCLDEMPEDYTISVNGEVVYD